jgi:anti-sigma factor RsiW
MNCARLQQVLDAHIDGELDHATQSEVAAHLAQCAACAALRDQRDTLRETLRAHAPYYTAPASLAPAMRARLGGMQRPATPRARRVALWWLPAATLTAVAAVAALVGLVAGYWLAQPQPDLALRDPAVASHVAALAPQRALVEVASSDRHTVKPWFQGRIDFAPPVKDLAGEGYALLGARLDQVGDRPAAAVVYKIRNHVINLYVWRASGLVPDAIAAGSVRGFTVATWAAGGLRYAAVSDVDGRDLMRFAQLVNTP